MNKRIIFLMVLIGFSIYSINAQITIRKNDVVERPVFKPKQFDSLTNIVMQKPPIEYKKYIGYKLFFLPKSKKYKPKYSSDNKERIIDFLFSNDTIQIRKEGKIPFKETTMGKIYLNASKRGHSKTYNEKKKNYEDIDKEKTNIYKPHFYHSKTDKTDGKIYGKIGTYPDSVYGRYFSILNIEGKEAYPSKEYKKLDDIDIEDSKSSQLSLKITLRNEENQDVLYWIVDQARFIGNPFFLVPYFEKQREIYLNKNVVLRYPDRTNTNLKNLIDVNTGEAINIKYGEVWTCSDISFIESKDSYYLKCFYFLKKGDKEVKIGLESKLLREYFMLETEFKQQKIEKQRKEEERKKEEEERQKIVEQERITFKKECIAKWGQKMGGYIADGKVLLGMNKKMCIVAWGKPININRTMVSGLISEQWVYGWGTYLYFNNGKLTAIQD